MHKRSRDGAAGERRAARALTRAGLRIVERNFRCRAGELDLVAMAGRTLVFVEVRCRAGGHHGPAESSVGPVKQRQVARVASHYLAVRRPSFDGCRFDVVAITGSELLWIRDAFRPGWP